jgi:hypothetical protein
LTYCIIIIVVVELFPLDNYWHKCSSRQQLRSFPFSLHHIDRLHPISFFHPHTFFFVVGEGKVSLTCYFLYFVLRNVICLICNRKDKNCVISSEINEILQQKDFNQKNFAGASTCELSWDKEDILSRDCCCCEDNNEKVFLSHTHILCDTIFVWTFSCVVLMTSIEKLFALQMNFKWLSS